MKHLFKTLFVIPVLLVALQVSAQLKQFTIRSMNRSEMATNVLALEDSSSIIVGYIYDISGSNVQRADIIAMRVSQNGTIMWQWQYGNALSDGNNIPFGLSLAANGDILIAGVIGQNSTFQDNTGFVFRIEPNTGGFVWRNFIRENPDPLQNGESLCGVTELADGRILAVGSSNCSNFGSRALISVFDGMSGNNLYNETYDIPGVANDLYDVVAVDDRVYILGEYSGHYKDLHLFEYFPGTTGGTIGWNNFYDMGSQFNNNLVSMYLNRPRRLHLRNDKLIFQGYGSEGYGPTPYGQFIFECNADGTNPDARYLENSGGRKYVGNTMFYPVDEHNMFIVQNPTASFANATTWIPSSTSDAFAGQIDIFGGTDALLQGKRFNLPANQSLMDVHLSSTDILHMVGVTAATPANNDIYYVLGGSVLNNYNATCDITDDEVTFGTPVITPETNAYDSNGFTTDPRVYPTEKDPGLTVVKICGDDTLVFPCSANVVEIEGHFDTADENNNCKFKCTAIVTPIPGWTPVQYEWQLPALPAYSWPPTNITSPSGAYADTKNFTTPNGSAWVYLKVYVTYVNSAGDTCIAMDSIRLDCNGGHGFVYNKPEPTSVQELAAKTNDAIFTVYPNPTNGMVTIASAASNISTVRIIDITGKEVTAYTYTGSDKVSVSLNSLANGTYIIQVNNSSQILINKTE